MRTFVQKFAPYLAILGCADIIFNGMVYVGVAAGGTADYVPYLNAPLKIIPLLAQLFG